MRASMTRSILFATAIALGGCGGGGGAGITSTPPPPPPPPPAAAFVLVPAASTSQQFAVIGASSLALGDTPRLGAAEQLQVRYVASSNSYEIQLPNSPTWIALVGNSEVEAAGGGLTVVRYLSHQYSSVIEYFGGPTGVQAVGIATAAGAVPITGSATYTAFAYGRTSESAGRQLIDPLVLGTMTLNFDFAHGSLSGSLSAQLDPEWHHYDLGTFNFRETVYSAGSTTFSGEFDTEIPGLNSFGGLFTGPNAEELIGNFALPYRSPIDGQNYQAAGAFLGERP